MPPAARLWLARASLHTDGKGRTSYGPTRCAADIGLDDALIEAGINWLLARGLVCHDHADQGTECWRLMHYGFDAKTARIGGYGPDRMSPRDGLPPMYGRPVSAVISPPDGNLDYTPPPWSAIAPTITEGDPDEMHP